MPTAPADYDLDTALSNSFHQILSRLRDDPYELNRRLARMRGATHRRPLRSWCLCIRASDTRLRNGVTALFDESLASERLPHALTLTATHLRQLTRPVTLGPQGTR